MSDEMIGALNQVAIQRHLNTLDSERNSRYCQAIQAIRVDQLCHHRAYEAAFAEIRATWAPKVPLPADHPDPRTDDAGWTAYRLAPYRRRGLVNLLGPNPSAGFYDQVRGQFEIYRREARVRSRETPVTMTVDPVFTVPIVVEGLSMRPFWKALALTEALTHRFDERLAYTVKAVLEDVECARHLRQAWAPLPGATLTEANFDQWLRDRIAANLSDPALRHDIEATLAQSNAKWRAQEEQRYDDGQKAHDAAPAFAQSAHHYVKMNYLHAQRPPDFLHLAIGQEPAWWYGEAPHSEARMAKARERVEAEHAAQQVELARQQAEAAASVAPPPTPPARTGWRRLFGR